MAIDIVIEFVAKSTIRIGAYVYDKDGNLVNPTTSIKITITDPDGTVQVPSVGDGDDDMTQVGEETGTYEYFYKTTADSVKGWWQGEVWVIDGEGAEAKTSFGDFSFRLK